MNCAIFCYWSLFLFIPYCFVRYCYLVSIFLLTSIRHINYRATNGNQTIDAPTEVVVLSPAVFDDTKTGVAKNASRVVVISCKARGKPKPELSLRLYDEYGPDLIKSGMYKVRKA